MKTYKVKVFKIMKHGEGTIEVQAETPEEAMKLAKTTLMDTSEIKYEKTNVGNIVFPISYTVSGEGHSIYNKEGQSLLDKMTIEREHVQKGK